MDNKYDAVMERIACWYVLDKAPVVTEGMIRDFEREIGHELPAAYRHFVGKYSFSVGRAYTGHGKLNRTTHKGK